jgi:hypothetical protein
MHDYNELNKSQNTNVYKKYVCDIYVWSTKRDTWEDDSDSDDDEFVLVCTLYDISEYNVNKKSDVKVMWDSSSQITDVTSHSIIVSRLRPGYPRSKLIFPIYDDFKHVIMLTHRSNYTVKTTLLTKLNRVAELHRDDKLHRDAELHRDVELNRVE